MNKIIKVLCIGFGLAAIGSAETVTNNLNVSGGFVYNHGFINAGDIYTNGVAFTNTGIRDVTISAGQLSGVNPETGMLITNPANLLSIKAQSLATVSNVTAGGKFIGDGSGLTNLKASSITGSLNAGNLPTSGSWNAAGLTVSNLAFAGNVASMTNLMLDGVLLAQAISNRVVQGGEAGLHSLTVSDGCFAVLSGSDAGAYSGAYYLAGTDVFYGDYYTNSAGKFLFIDVDSLIGWGVWVLGDALSQGVYTGSLGGDWFDVTVWDQHEIYMRASKSVSIGSGNITAEGTIRGAALRCVDMNGGAEFIDLSPGAGSGAASQINVSSYEESIQVAAILSSIYAGWGTQILGANPAGTSASIYYSQLLSVATRGTISIAETGGNCESISGSWNATDTSIVGSDIKAFAGVVQAVNNPIEIRNVSAALACVRSAHGKSVILDSSNLLLAGDNLTVSNKTNVGMVGQGMTAFKSDAMYAGSFVAGSGNGAYSTNNRIYFGSNSWLYVSGTNIMFRGTNGTITALGSVSQAVFTGSFSGNGAGLTNLNAANLTAGTLPVARLPATGLNASSLTMGTLPAAQLPASGINASAITIGTLPVAQLPSSGLSASALTTGTLPVAQLPASGISAATITTGTLPAAQLPTNGINASSLTVGSIPLERIPNATTNSSGLMTALDKQKLAAINLTNVWYGDIPMFNAN